MSAGSRGLQRSRPIRVIPFVMIFVFGLTVRGAGQNTENQTVMQMRSFIERFTADEALMRRVYSIPMSEADVSEMESFFKKWQTGLQKIEFDTLTLDGRVDYVLFDNLIKRRLTELALERERIKRVEAFLPFYRIIVDLELNRRTQAKIDPRIAADALWALKGAVLTALKGCGPDKNGDPPKDRERIDALDAGGMLKRLKRTLERWYRFYHGYDPEFTWWAESPYEEAMDSITRYLKRLESLSRPKDD